MIVFVGDKPSPKMKHNALPFQGAACEKRLLKWINEITDGEYKLMNRIDPYFHMMVRLYNYEGHKIVALGGEAAKWLKIMGIIHFRLPHPSGRNRQLNNPRYVTKKLKECKEWLAN